MLYLKIRLFDTKVRKIALTSHGSQQASEPAHSSVKCNTLTNVGKKLHGEFYSLVFFEVYYLVDSESV